MLVFQPPPRMGGKLQAGAKESSEGSGAKTKSGAEGEGGSEAAAEHKGGFLDLPLKGFLFLNIYPF